MWQLAKMSPTCSKGILYAHSDCGGFPSRAARAFGVGETLDSAFAYANKLDFQKVSIAAVDPDASSCRVDDPTAARRTVFAVDDIFTFIL
jgi:hypothetical protein